MKSSGVDTILKSCFLINAGSTHPFFSPHFPRHHSHLDFFRIPEENKTDLSIRPCHTGLSKVSVKIYFVGTSISSSPGTVGARSALNFGLLGSMNCTDSWCYNFQYAPGGNPVGCLVSFVFLTYCNWIWYRSTNGDIIFYCFLDSDLECLFVTTNI